MLNIAQIRPESPTAQTLAEGQYSLFKILVVWASVTLPMGVLTWIIAPVLIERLDYTPGLIYWWLIILGMAWQFVVAIYLLFDEGQIWTVEALKARLWLRRPIDLKIGLPKARLWWWILPCAFFAGLTSEVFGDLIDAPFLAAFPWITFPDYANIQNLATPEFEGRWDILAIALVSFIFNYILGEALLFHGVLLPKMEGVFGKQAWFANGCLYGLYHVHLIWALPSIIISNLAYSWPAQRYRSVWLAVIIHGLEGVIIIGIIAWVIFGGI